MTDEQAFWEAIDLHPGDLLPVSVFADWLGERCDPREEPLRWCVAEGKVPRYAGAGFVWDPDDSRHSEWTARVPGQYLWIPIVAGMTRPNRSPSQAYERLCLRWLLAKENGHDPLAAGVSPAGEVMR